MRKRYPDELVLAIREARAATGQTYKALGAAFGISKKMAHAYCTGGERKSVAGPTATTTHIVIPADVVLGIRIARATERATYQAIADRFGVHKTTAIYYCQGKKRRSVGGPIEGVHLVATSVVVPPPPPKPKRPPLTDDEIVAIRVARATDNPTPTWQQLGDRFNVPRKIAYRICVGTIRPAVGGPLEPSTSYANGRVKNNDPYDVRRQLRCPECGRLVHPPVDGKWPCLACRVADRSAERLVVASSPWEVSLR